MAVLSRTRARYTVLYMGGAFCVVVDYIFPK